MAASDPHLPDLDPDLVALANAYGVAVEYVDQAGVLRKVGAPTIRAVLSAMGVEAKTAAQCQTSLRTMREHRWRSIVPPSIVLRRNPADSDPWETWIHATRDATFRVWIDLENGGRRFDISATDKKRELGRVDGKIVDEVVVRIPKDLPLGWHQLVAEVAGQTASCALVVTPERLELPVLASSTQDWGVATQIYSARSHRSWGIGDLSDLADMAAWFGREHGADFVLVNPLHASVPTVGMEPSPYLPVTRRFANPIYLRVEAIEEFAYLPPADREFIEIAAAKAHETLNNSDLLDRDTAWELKEPALRRVFAVARTPGRQASFDAYVQSQGAGLVEFGVWSVLATELGPYWNEWPAEFQDHQSEEVQAFAVEHEQDIAFHIWMQWILDEQMSCAQAQANAAGMQIGIMHDLAVGVHRFGSDTWAQPNDTAKEVTVGAPPDTFNQVGQNWSQPPRRPDQLAATGYASYRDMLRTLLRHSGGLRIDHVLGLFRLWWIPVGMSPAEGTYVRYDHHAMVNILVLEAQRAGAVIVGEDLGTVEPWVQGFLADRGILGTTILWFESKDGEPIDPRKWRANALTAVTVHDLPPTRGYLAGDHVKLRDELGLLSESVDVVEAAHVEEVAAWRAALERNNLIRPSASDREVVVALHRYVTWSPSKLLAVSLPDLVGQRATQNQPGTKDEYPNWRIPLADADDVPVYIEDLPGVELLARIVAAVGGSAGQTRSS